MHYITAPNIDFTLVKLVSWQKWYHLEEILQRDDDDDQNMSVFDDRVTKNRFPEEHILHLACQYQAPCQIVELLAKKFPQSISCAERKGRHPIHIACAKGSNPKVIDFLIKSYPQAAGVQDDYGKTPLHYVCESYGDNFKTIPSNAYRSPEHSLLTVISLLLDEVPESANVEDIYGMNAIEYAIDSNIGIGIIKVMQNASRENWRTMKKVHRGKSHEELRHSITSLSTSINSLNLSSENLDRLHEKMKDKDISVAMHIDTTEAKVQAARTA